MAYLNFPIKWLVINMLFFDYSPFANIKNDYFKALNETTKYSKARFQKAIFDEVHMIESIDVVCTPDKQEWGYDTVFLWKGSNLEAGNVHLSGIPINHILIRRRKKDEFIFENIKAIDFDPNIQFYEFKDRFIESHEDYVYGIQPMGGSLENPILGETTTAEVESYFDSVWIVGKDTQYKLTFDLEVNGYETVIPTGIIETLGNRFPTIVGNGDIKYRRGKLQCKLVSDVTINNGYIDPKEEKKIRRAIMAFLTDKKPKYYKDGSGESMLISIINSIQLTPINDFNRLLYNVSLEFVEIGGTDIQSLINAGLVSEV